MSIFTCSSPPEESKDKELLAPITEQLHAVSTVIDGLRERVVELSSECYSRLGDCAFRVKAMEKKLDKLSDPLSAMSNEELQRIVYILELIKKAQVRRRQGDVARKKKSAVEQVRHLLAELDENLALLMRKLDSRFEDVNHRLHNIRGSSFERLEDLENRLLELNVRAIRRTLCDEAEGRESDI